VRPWLPCRSLSNFYQGGTLKKREYAALRIFADRWGLYYRLTKSFLAFGSEKAMRLKAADMNEDENE
jgi:hypothetical protein